MDTKLDNIFILAFFVFATIAILIVILWIVKTEKRLKKFFLGKKARDLEETISILGSEIRDLRIAKEKAEEDLKKINNKMKKSVRGLETVRFNPFPDQGSNQSFAIGFLDEENNGVVISSLYSRDRMSVFAKPIKNGKSEYELTKEEDEVLKKAKIND